VTEKTSPSRVNITEKPAVRASSVEWLRLLYEGTEKYEGEAGTFTLTIEIDANYTGAARSATITITSGTDKITVTVTQDGKTEDGTIPDDPDPIENGSSRLVSNVTIYHYWGVGGYGRSMKDGVTTRSEDGVTTRSYDFTYDNHSRLTKIVGTDSDDGVVGESTISYPDATTMVLSNFGDGFTVTCTLNANGSIASASIDTGSMTYPYTDGYLQKTTAPTTTTIVEVDKQEDGTILNERETEHAGTYTINYTWSGGNPVSVVEKNEYPTAPEANYTSNYTYTYGSTLNKPGGIDLASIFVVNSMGMAARGWYGKPSKALPTIVKEEYIRSYGYPYVYETHYRYETDSEGYTLKIYEREKREDGAWVYDERLYCTVAYR
jgi:translation elongation factor P/translation initiation factor 5A